MGSTVSSDQGLGTGRPPAGHHVGNLPSLSPPHPWWLVLSLVSLPPWPIHLAARRFSANPSLTLPCTCSRTLSGSLLPMTDIQVHQLPQVPPQQSLVPSDTEPPPSLPRPPPTSCLGSSRVLCQLLTTSHFRTCSKFSLSLKPASLLLTLLRGAFCSLVAWGFHVSPWHSGTPWWQGGD